MAVKESGLSIVAPELRKCKRELEEGLYNLIEEFQKETGLKVTRIDRTNLYWYSTDPNWKNDYTQGVRVTVEV